MTTQCDQCDWKWLTNLISVSELGQIFFIRLFTDLKINSAEDPLYCFKVVCGKLVNDQS